MTKYYALLTNLGAAKLANAAALGTKLQITHMSVGDGGGTLPTPNASQTALVAEKRRAALNGLSVDAANSSQIIAEQIIPESDGGFWIREIGLFDADGVMIAVANCPETYKPQLQEGSGRTQTVRMILIVNSTDAVTLKIDPAVVLATRKYVDDGVIVVKAYSDSLMAQHLAAADPHPVYAPKASPTFSGKPAGPTAAKTDSSTQLATTAHVKGVVGDYAPLASPALSGSPTAPTAVAGNNSQQLANTAFVQTAIAALVAGSPAALDTLKELADALGGDAHFATTVLNALAEKMSISALGSDVSDIETFLKNITADGVKTPTSVTSAAASFLASPNRNFRLVVVNTGDWGVYNVATNEVVALPVQRGGTGGKSRDDLVNNFALRCQRRWISAEQSMLLGMPIILNHGLPITDAWECYSDVMMVCTVANNGYSVGDIAIGPQGVDGSTGANRTFSMIPVLTKTTIQMNVGASSVYVVNKANGTIVTLNTSAMLANWRLYFRIFY